MQKRKARKESKQESTNQPLTPKKRLDSNLHKTFRICLNNKKETFKFEFRHTPKKSFIKNTLSRTKKQNTHPEMRHWIILAGSAK